MSAETHNNIVIIKNYIHYQIGDDAPNESCAKKSVRGKEYVGINKFTGFVSIATPAADVHGIRDPKERKLPAHLIDEETGPLTRELVDAAAQH